MANSHSNTTFQKEIFRDYDLVYIEYCLASRAIYDEIYVGLDAGLIIQ